MHDIVVTVPMKGRSFSCATLLDGVIHIWWESLYYADPTGLFDILATWRDDNDIQWSQDAAGNVTVVVPPPDPGESQQISAAKAA